MKTGFGKKCSPVKNTKYPYSPELPKPVQINNIDFEDPQRRRVMMKFREFNNWQVKELGYPVINFGSTPCYRVEPDSSDILPAILYFHGGAFVFPMETMMLRNARFYSDKLNVRVFLPEYLLAPEHPFPEPFEECCGCYKYLLEHCSELKVDPQRIIIYGDSAGGTMAASVCQWARDTGLHMPAAQFLMYMAADDTFDYPSIEEYADSKWPKSAYEQIWPLYYKNGYCGMPQYAVPMKSRRFDSLPPAYVELCQCDILHDEGLAYADAMKSSGVDVTIEDVAGAYHGYDFAGDSPLVGRMLLRRCSEMKKYI